MRSRIILIALSFATLGLGACAGDIARYGPAYGYGPRYDGPYGTRRPLYDDRYSHSVPFSRDLSMSPRMDKRMTCLRPDDQFICYGDDYCTCSKQPPKGYVF